MKNLLFVAKCTLLQKETESNKNGLKTVNKNQDGSGITVELSLRD
jgi:hypothetical protein